MSEVIEGQATPVEDPAQPSTTTINVVTTFKPELQTQLRMAAGALEVAKVFEVINTAEECEEAVIERNSNLKEIDALTAGMDELLSPFRSAMAEIKKGVDRIASIIKPRITQREQAVAFLNQRISEFNTRERQRYEEEQRRLREEQHRAHQEAEQRAAAARAEAEQRAAAARAQAEATEKARIEAEVAGNADAAAQLAAQAAEHRQVAEHAVESGERAAQEAVVQATAASQAVSVAPPPKIAGNTEREKWVPELMPDMDQKTAKRLICEAIVGLIRDVNGVEALSGQKRDALLALFKMDETALRKLAESLKDNMKVPGYVAVRRFIQAGKRK